jgi:hypothetical protein
MFMLKSMIKNSKFLSLFGLNLHDFAVDGVGFDLDTAAVQMLK